MFHTGPLMETLRWIVDGASAVGAHKQSLASKCPWSRASDGGSCSHRLKTETVFPTTLGGGRLPPTFPIHHSSTVCLTSLYNEVDAIHGSCSKNTGRMTYNQLYQISTSLIKRLKRKLPTVLCKKSFHSVCWRGFPMIVWRRRRSGWFYWPGAPPNQINPYPHWWRCP